jgi:hypothetical protein
MTVSGSKRLWCMLRHYSKSCLDGLSKSTTNLGYVNRYPGLYSNPGPLKYKGESQKYIAINFVCFNELVVMWQHKWRTCPVCLLPDTKHGISMWSAGIISYFWTLLSQLKARHWNVNPNHVYRFYVLDMGWTIGVLGFDSRRGLGIILFTTASRTAPGPTQPLIQWVPGALSLGVKWPEREADHSPPSSDEVKECAELYLHPQ